MKKKIITGLSSILLFTLLLGCFGNCYATEFSENQLKNIAYNSLTNFGTHLMSETKNMLDSLDLSSVASKTYDYDYVYITMNIRDSDSVPNANVYMTVYFSNDSTHFSTINSIRCKERCNINFKNYSPVVTWNSTNNETNIAQNGYNSDSWRYNDLDLYSTTSGGNITLASGWHPSNIDDAIYYDIQWNFSPRADGSATMDGDSSGRTYYLIDSIYQCNIGAITDSYMVDSYKYRIGSWNGSAYIFSNWKTAFKHRNNYYFPDYAPATSVLNSNNSYTTTLYLDTNGNGNNLLQVVFTPIQAYKDYYDLEDIEVFYYITNNYSRISGGVIYPKKTFSGDYTGIYISQEQTNDIIGTSEQNTQEIKDTITDDSQVDSMLEETLSGDKIINDIGFNFVVNPFEDIIKNTLIGFTNALLGSGNETINFSIYNHNYAIHSEDFTLPNGALKSFISLLCNAFVVYNICKYGFKLYEWINTGRIQNLVNEQNRHQYYLF